MSLASFLSMSELKMGSHNSYGRERLATNPAINVPEQSPRVQTVKMGVQYSLWGGSVMNLGTERHKQQHFEAIDKYRLPGKPLHNLADANEDRVV